MNLKKKLDNLDAEIKQYFVHSGERSNNLSQVKLSK